MEIAELANYVPAAVIVAIFLCIVLTNASLGFVSDFEDYLEKIKNKQIKFFDHKKIWMSFIWCVILAIILAVCSFISWKELPFYLLVIMGGSTFFYEAILKTIKRNKDDSDD